MAPEDAVLNLFFKTSNSFFATREQKKADRSANYKTIRERVHIPPPRVDSPSRTGLLPKALTVYSGEFPEKPSDSAVNHLLRERNSRKRAETDGLKFDYRTPSCYADFFAKDGPQRLPPDAFPHLSFMGNIIGPGSDPIPSSCGLPARPRSEPGGSRSNRHWVTAEAVSPKSSLDFRAQALREVQQQRHAVLVPDPKEGFRQGVPKRRPPSKFEGLLHRTATAPSLADQRLEAELEEAKGLVASDSFHTQYRRFFAARGGIDPPPLYVGPTKKTFPCGIKVAPRSVRREFK